MPSKAFTEHPEFIKASAANEIGIMNAANYHGEKAVAAYLSGDMDLFCRHAAIADRLWASAASQSRRAA